MESAPHLNALYLWRDIEKYVYYVQLSSEERERLVRNVHQNKELLLDMHSVKLTVLCFIHMCCVC